MKYKHILLCILMFILFIFLIFKINSNNLELQELDKINTELMNENNLLFKSNQMLSDENNSYLSEIVILKDQIINLEINKKRLESQLNISIISSNIDEGVVLLKQNILNEKNKTVNDMSVTSIGY